MNALSFKSLSRRVARFPHEPDLNLVLLDGLQLLSSRHFHEVERDFRPDFTKSAHGHREQIVLHVQHVADFEGLGVTLAVAVQIIHVQLRLAEQPPRADEEEVTFLG